MVVLADTGARKLLHGAGVRTIARGVAADAVGMSFGLDGLWQLIAGLFAGVAHLLVLPFELLWTAVASAAAGVAHGFEGLWQLVCGFFGNIVAALGSAAHLLVLPFEAFGRWIQTAVAGIGHGFDGLWHGISGFFADIVATLATAAHGLVLPFEAFGRWIQTAVAGIGHGFDGLWHGISGFFADIVATLATAAHGLVLPFEAFWRWIQTAAAGIGHGFDGLWHGISGFLASVLAKIAGAAHELVEPLRAFWRWLRTAAADAAAGISFGFDGLWPLIQRIYASLLATLASAAHELAPRMESLWRWLRGAAAVALPYVLVIAAVLCVVALLWFLGPYVCCPAVATGQALVHVASYCALGLYPVAVGVGNALASVVPCCGQWCIGVAMSAPGGSGMLISRAAFEAFPALFFEILRSAGPVVTCAVFCLKCVAMAVAKPVAALFRVK